MSLNQSFEKQYEFTKKGKTYKTKYLAALKDLLQEVKDVRTNTNQKETQTARGK